MKDGMGTIYISYSEFLDFVAKQGDFEQAMTLIIGKPENDGGDDIFIDYVFSETIVDPENTTHLGDKTRELKASWDTPNSPEAVFTKKDAQALLLFIRGLNHDMRKGFPEEVWNKIMKIVDNNWKETMNDLVSNDNSSSTNFNCGTRI